MGMGSAPASATCISKENLAELCPDQLKQLETKLDDFDVTLGQLAGLLDETSTDYEDHECVGPTQEQSNGLFNAD